MKEFLLLGIVLALAFIVGMVANIADNLTTIITLLEKM